MRTEYIKEFCTLAEVKNFTLTAEKLYITQPALSRHMEQLEEELGVKLLERTNKKVDLTDAGSRLYPEFLQLLNVSEKIKNSAVKLKTGVKGQLNIGSVHYMNADYWNRVILKMREEFPDVEIFLNQTSPRVLLGDVLNKKTDLGLMMCFSDKDLEETEHFNVRKEGFKAIVPSQSVFASKSCISLKDLSSCRLVFSTEEPEFNSFFLNILAQYIDVKQENCFYVSQMHTFELKKVEYEGIGFVPDCYVNSFVPYTKLIPIKEKIECDINWVYRTDNENPCVSRFLELCRKIRS